MKTKPTSKQIRTVRNSLLYRYGWRFPLVQPSGACQAFRRLPERSELMCRWAEAFQEPGVCLWVGNGEPCDAWRQSLRRIVK